MAALKAPENLQVFPSDKALIVNWLPIIDEALGGYSISMTDEAGTLKSIAITKDSTSISIDNLTNGEKYSIAIASVTDEGIGEYSIPAVGVPDNTRPAEPQQVNSPTSPEPLTPQAIPPVKLAMVIDGEVVDVLFTDERLAAIFLSAPTVVDVTDATSEVKAGYLFDAQTRMFSIPPISIDTTNLTGEVNNLPPMGTPNTPPAGN